MRFGIFEADVERRVLTKGGLRIKLQDQPFLVLSLLLDHPGEVVTRDEIRQKLWTADTFVEFDDGLNTAIKKLRLALGDTADNPRFIETVPRRGYRFLAPVIFSALANPAESKNLQETALENVVIASRESSRVVVDRTTTGPRSLRAALGLVLAVTAAVGGYFYRAQLRSGPGPQEPAAATPSSTVKPRPSVAVMGFRNLSRQRESAWLSTAMAEMLSTELAAGRRLRMVAGENIARTKRELPLEDTDTLARDTLTRLHTNLDADYVVLGSYTALGHQSRGRIRLDLRLQDARTGEIVAEEAVSGQESNLFDLISQAGLRLREKLSAGDLSNEDVLAIRASLPANPAAARFFAEGLAKLRIYENLAARDLLLQAVSLEPGHALAHSSLASSWKALGYDGRAQEEAKKAWSLSKNLAREDQLWIEAFYRETTADWDQAIEIYRTLARFFPDNLEYGLRLAETQSNASKGKEGLATIKALRGLPPPLSEDPRIDLQEAYAGNQLGDYKLVQTASDNAARKAEKRGALLLLARAKLLESTAARNLDDPRKARSLDEEAQHIYEGAGDAYGAARARIRVADLLFRQGEFSQSNIISEQCLSVFRAHESNKDVANALDDIGGGLIEMGELEKAKSAYDAALAVQKEIGNKRGEAQELNNLGVILDQQGDLGAALKAAEQTRDLYQAVGEKDGVAGALNNIAEILFLRGDLLSAKKMYSESLAMRRELANESDVAESLHNIAEVLGYQGDVSGAHKDYDEALAIRIRREELGAAAQTRLGKAELLLETGDAGGAELLARAAIDQFKKEKQLSDEISAHTVLAQALLELGRLPEASSEIAQARQLSNKNQSRRARLATEIVAARLLAPTNPNDSVRRLKAVVQEAETFRLFILELKASLALAQVEMASGSKVAGRARLQLVEKDAQSKGFVLIAHKAAAARG